MIYRKPLTIILFFILSVSVVLTTGSTLYAREEGFFFIERPKLSLGTSYKIEDEERKNPEIKKETTTHDIQETVGLGTKGWVYHPNLMEYRLFLEPEWRQEKFEYRQSDEDSELTSRRKTSVLAYDAGTTLLRQKPCSLDVYANRNNRRLDMTSVRDTDIESETWGTRLNFTNPTLPASFGFVNRKVDQTGFYRSEEDQNEVQATIRHNAQRSVTELKMIYDDTQRTTWSTSETTDTVSEMTNTELNNTFFFTEDDRVRLNSLLYNTRAKYDDSDYDTWVWSENLFCTHSKNLLSRYTANYNRHEVDNTDTEEKAVRAGLTHRLFDRLTTNFNVEAAANDFFSGSQDSYRSDLGFLYRRPVSWGSLELGAAYDYGVTRRSGEESVIPTEERHVLSSSAETYLSKENVELDTIVVTDVPGTRVFVRDIDYRVEAFGPDVRISRTVLGDIEDGQLVSVRYSYRLDTNYDDSRFAQTYRFGLDLWSFFFFTYTHGRLDQNIISGKLSGDPIDDTYNTFRIRLDADWTETQFLYEDQNRSNGNSSVTKSVRQLINLRPLRNFHFNFSGDYGQRDFTDTDEKETFFTLGTDMGWTPVWWCNVSLICLRNKISGDRQDMLNSEIGPTIRLAYGVWTGSISYRLTDQKDDENGDSLWRQRIYFAVNRSLW